MQEDDRHTDDGEPERTALRFGPFRLLRSERLLLDGDRPVRVSGRALDILLALVEQPGRTYSRDELISRVWPGTVIEDVNLRAHVSALRRALGDGPGGQPYLVTIPGRGYSFVGSLANETATAVVAAAAAVPPRTQPSAWPVRLGRVHGRGDVIARIQAQLPQHRLISIVGPGGIGKSTVASTLADAVGGAYPDGIQWVDLATLDRDETVPAATAFALGLDNFATDPTPGIVTTLRDRRMLLILDCCERVVRGAARIADSVLRGAPQVHMLATSRERLRTAGEYVVRLPPLGAPVPTGELTVEEAMEYPAIQLFVERAMAALDSFTLTEANLPTVVRLCSRLEGIALAIELAAGSLAGFGLEQLANLLEGRLRLTASGRRTAQPRHRTMQATLDWSYGTLPEPERLVLQHMAVFDGGADLAAIRAVAADATIDPVAVVANLAQLVDKSLVAAEINGATVRYRLLDTTRSYALDKLTASGELPVVTRRHGGVVSPAAAGLVGRRKREPGRIHGGPREYSRSVGLGHIPGWRCGVCHDADPGVRRAVDGALAAWRMPCTGWHRACFARSRRRARFHDRIDAACGPGHVAYVYQRTGRGGRGTLDPRARAGRDVW